MRMRVPLYVLLGALVLASPLPLGAQEDPVVTAINAQLTKHTEVVAGWERKALLVITLTVIVGVLGIVTGVLQPLNRPWCKIATVAAGGVVSLITVLTTSVFEADHRTFASKSRQVKGLIDDVHLILAKGRPNTEEDRQVWIDEMRDKLKQITDLEVQLVGPRSAFDRIAPSSVAFAAAPGEPPWIANPPTDEVNLYFVGVGESASLASAKDYSRANGVERAIDFLTHTFGQQKPEVSLDVEALSEYVARSMDVVDTYYADDPAKKVYRYSTLFRLNRRFAETSITLFAARQRVKTPAPFSQAIQSSRGAQDPYYQRRTQQYAEAMTAAQSALSAESYETFLKGRQLRRTGREREALPLLNEVVARNDAFYLGWFNLALAYDDLNMTQAADRAYRKAAELEPRQSVPDASFYNSYGFFLYRQGRKREAATVLRRALEIDPNHPKAKRTLELSLKNG